MTAPITAWQIGEEAVAKKPPLGRFGCKSVQRVSIRPVTILPAAMQGPLSLEPATTDREGMARGEEGETR